jgi:signal transduction histidine kinase/DNA-binding response OmpR family regulator
MLTLVAEVLFAVIFVRVLLFYLRGRDALQRDVALIFLPPMVVFMNSVFRQFVGPTPRAVGAVVTVILLAQPYLTLRLTGRLTPVPQWLDRLLLMVYVVTAVPLAVAPRPLAPELLLLMVVTFVSAECVAAGFLLAGARRRSGAARVRLWIVALATFLFPAMMVLIGINATLHPGTVSNFTSASRIVALLSGFGYAVAFMPPAWLRRVWSATSWYSANQELQTVPVTASAAEVWQRYVEIVRDTAGAQAVVLLSATPEGRVTRVAADGLAGPPPGVHGVAELERLLSAAQPVYVPELAASSLAADYGHAAGARYVTALPIELSSQERGALVLLDGFRSLFTLDDVRLAGVLGRQAATLAERVSIIEGQRRLAEELAASVDALTHASQAKSDFLASMSHELRTPLNAIIGFSDLMRVEQPDGERRTVPADWVDHIHSSGRHLLGLINDILDLAKVEAGRMELHTEALRLDSAISDVITGLRPLTARKDLRVEVHVPAVAALVDPLRFRQILDNLLSNAIKFTPEGGRISVSATRDGDEVAICVADTGIGIAPEDQARVFEEFQQLGNAAQRKAGTGLGLALTRRLAEAHGGSVTLASKLGEGSQFTVWLPAAAIEERAPTSPAPATGEPRPNARGRVLIVDDDARAAELLRTYLTSGGYEVTTVGTGESGLETARTWVPDAILLDVVMPGIDGWAVIRELKRDEATRDIPVFFTSILDDRRAGMSLGATEYFVKPVDHDALLTQLSRHVIPTASNGPSAVLVVDRDDRTRSVVEGHLRAEGIDVVSCDDGREGLRLSQQRRFDLIICDLEVSEAGGFELLNGLDGDPATRGIPVLALTAPELSEADRARMTGRVIGAVSRGAATSGDLREWVDLATVASAMSRASPLPIAAITQEPAS